MLGRYRVPLIAVLLTLMLLATVSLARGCERESRFTIRVTGTDGLGFHGSLTIVQGDGQVLCGSIEDTVPWEWHDRGSSVSVYFQSQADTGDLRVEIIKNGRVVAVSETASPYGVVTAASE